MYVFESDIYLKSECSPPPLNPRLNCTWFLFQKDLYCCYSRHRLTLPYSNCSCEPESDTSSCLVRSGPVRSGPRLELLLLLISRGNN